MKLTRGFAQFLFKCENDGKKNEEELTHGVKFFKDKEGYPEVIRCIENLEGEAGLSSCLPICVRFNPTKYNKFFEGGIDKLVYFND